MRLLLFGLAGVAAAPSADEPVWIGGVKQLFVDDSLIAASSGSLERVMNPPAKLGRRVVQPDAPWERALNTSLGLYSSVMREGNTTRLWYFETREGSEDTGFTVKRPFLQAYAEAGSDGLAFTKPSLGQVKLNGTDLPNNALAVLVSPPSPPSACT